MKKEEEQKRNKNKTQIREIPNLFPLQKQLSVIDWSATAIACHIEHKDLNDIIVINRTRFKSIKLHTGRNTREGERIRMKIRNQRPEQLIAIPRKYIISQLAGYLTFNVFSPRWF